MIEMNKNKDVRPRASRFSRQQIKQSGQKLLSGLNGGDFVVSWEKSKRIKRLSAVNNNNSESNKGSCSYEVEEEKKCEMGGGGGCDVFDKEVLQAPSATIGTASTSNKRFKLPRKQLIDDCNGVVPRKLRSAMKKRNRESVSPPFPDSKKLSHSHGGVESLKRDGLKKLGLKVTQPGPDWSSKQSVCGPITKDEEEVVETLYSLAGMFTNNEEPKNDCKLGNASLDASRSTLQERSESDSPIIEAVKEDLNSICLPRIDEAAEETWHVETAKVDCLNEPSFQDWPTLSSDKVQGELGSCVAQVNLPTMFAKQEELKPLCDSFNLFIAPEQYQDTVKVKQSAQLETSLERKPDIALGLTATVSQQDQRHTICQSKTNGPALWPGLSSTVSSGACNYGSSSQSSATKFPSWMDTDCGATRPSSFQKCSSTGKASKVNTGKRSWKRSSTHVYISRLIQVLQIPESRDSLPLNLNQLRPHDILRQGVFMTINNFNGNRNGLNGATPSRAIVNMTDKNSNQRQRLHQDQPQTPSGVYNSQKQTFNFLSLSTGGGSLEANNISNGVGNRSEQSAQQQFPYLHSHLQQQHSTLASFPMSQAYCTSSSYPDQPAAQQARVPQPPYFGNLYCGSRTSPSGFAKQQQEQQQEHQEQLQRLWEAQLAAAQYRTSANSTTMTQFPNWQNVRQDSPTQISRAQPTIPTLSSQEALGPKYAQISQQQLMTITTLPHARVRRQDHHLSSVYEETGGGFRTVGALPLQLLCNDRL
ncbi:hypothetical protein POPTR_002G022800v4 [Populus trichocarpa]|uniref:Uncharacterized protein n=3 Tax=Populus trichocarpa TaxID=3694 RepID=A0ACC0TBR4_POPTR|nr:uncharacterized protein LOC7479680 isoform X1 [Populus trichocarpa]KAI9398927.1 hypothetical protein POPTR_002G022800v4 [Populus trichocarpa]